MTIKTRPVMSPVRAGTSSWRQQVTDVWFNPGGTKLKERCKAGPAPAGDTMRVWSQDDSATVRGRCNLIYRHLNS